MFRVEITVWSYSVRVRVRVRVIEVRNMVLI